MAPRPVPMEPRMRKSAVPAFLGLFALAACGTAPPGPALQQAQSVYRSAATDPQVASTAPLEIRRAEEALRRAEAVQREDGNGAEVDHLAYVTQQRVGIARAVARATGARTVVEGAGTARVEARNEQLERQLAELQAQPTSRGYVVTIGDVLFATGSAELTAGALNRLNQLSDVLRQNPNATLEIEGHTDSTGSSGLNLRLSEARAQAVQRELLRAGVDPTRVTTRGLGAAQPVASNATTDGRQQNRRVEVVINDRSGAPATGAGSTGTTTSMPSGTVLR
jgi:outer membrane protein OmpA-like peptidoglycan-associated protein